MLPQSPLYAGLTGGPGKQPGLTSGFSQNQRTGEAPQGGGLWGRCLHSSRRRERWRKTPSWQSRWFIIPHSHKTTLVILGSLDLKRAVVGHWAKNEVQIYFRNHPSQSLPWEITNLAFKVPRYLPKAGDLSLGLSACVAPGDANYLSCGCPVSVLLSIGKTTGKLGPASPFTLASKKILAPKRW